MKTVKLLTHLKLGSLTENIASHINLRNVFE